MKKHHDSELERAGQHWSKCVAEFAGRKAGLFWWEVSVVQKRINAKISGDSSVDWLEYTVSKYFGDRLPLARCLSLGCGTGHLERALARLGVLCRFDAYDASADSIQLARTIVLRDGLLQHHYYVADVNSLVLESGIYDAIWISHAMHHFRELEHVIKQLRYALKPDGLLVLNEYVGPARFQFSPRQKEVANLCLRLLPARYRVLQPEAIQSELARGPTERGWFWFFSRLVDKMRDGGLLDTFRRRLCAYRARGSGEALVKTAITFPSARDVVAADPSEAVCSDKILEALEQDFEILERRDWGGECVSIPA